jgi:hypothetical protein
MNAIGLSARILSRFLAKVFQAYLKGKPGRVILQFSDSPRKRRTGIGAQGFTGSTRTWENSMMCFEISRGKSDFPSLAVVLMTAHFMALVARNESLSLFGSCLA